MGAPVTIHTTLGKRAKKIRSRVRRLVALVSANPPAGVIVGHSGGRNHLSPIGYLGRQLGTFAVEGSKTHPSDEWYYWTSVDGPVKHLTGLVNGLSSRHKQLTVIEAWLPEMEARFAPKETAGATVPVVEELEPQGHALALEAPERAARCATEDPEITALYAIKDALDGLDDYAIKRVLSWSADKFGLEFVVKPRVPHA